MNIDYFLKEIINDLNNQNFKQDDIKGVLFEKLIVESANRIKNKLESTKIIKIEHISGQKFPDIIINIDNHKIGIEAKTSNNSWTNLGGSIFESTRVNDIDEIYILMANYNEDRVIYKYNKYENVIDNVLITHSPRYHINMDSKVNIFRDIGIKYNDVHKEKYPFDLFKNFLKNKLGKDADFWWMAKDDDTSTPQAIININSLNNKEKEKIKIETLALFPILITNNNNKYQTVSSFLITKKGYYSSSLRDFYTAGGVFNFRDFSIPKIFSLYLDEKNLNLIKEYLSNPKNDYLINYYLKPLIQNKNYVNLYNEWLLLIIKNIKKMDIGEKQLIPSIECRSYMLNILKSTRQS